MTFSDTTRFGRADLHLHTMASDGTATALTMLERAEAEGLDVIAITDHDRIDAALAARAASSDRKSTRLNSSHVSESRMPSSA